MLEFARVFWGTQARLFCFSNLVPQSGESNAPFLFGFLWDFESSKLTPLLNPLARSPINKEHHFHEKLVKWKNLNKQKQPLAVQTFSTKKKSKFLLKTTSKNTQNKAFIIMENQRMYYAPSMINSVLFFYCRNKSVDTRVNDPACHDSSLFCVTYVRQQKANKLMYDWRCWKKAFVTGNF